MQSLLDFLKRILPDSALKKIRPLGHGFLAYLGALVYRFPSRRIIVIGVTGTAGKSTTVQMLSKILNDNRRKTGYITTVEFFDGHSKQINQHGMSMPGRFALHRQVIQMLKNKCEIAIIEVTSEGLAQNRHFGIDFDAALFTNLAPAHLDAHGGFEKYKRAKGKLFASLKNSYKKEFFLEKLIGLNLDDPASEYFGSFRADRKFGVSFIKKESDLVGEVYFAEQLEEHNGYSSFVIEDRKINLKLPGVFNARNALLALGAANALGISIENGTRSLQSFDEIAGRMQQIKNEKGFKIFLDYAPEPVAMRNALETMLKIPHKRLIHVFGSTGGHRDVEKRFEFGKISAASSDVIVITNDDVYESDPEKIAADIKTGINSVENKKVQLIEKVLDRKEAIKKAIQIAKAEDVILITGKGSEQFLVLPGNHRIAWDEKSVIEGLL